MVRLSVMTAHAAFNEQNTPTPTATPWKEARTHGGLGFGITLLCCSRPQSQAPGETRFTLQEAFINLVWCILPLYF